MRIKDISRENRLRERLERYGVGSLSNAELLAYSSSNIPFLSFFY